MAYKVLDYLITASWTGKGAAQGAAADIQEVGTASHTTGLSLTDLKSGLDLAMSGFQAAGQMVGEFYDALKEGAALESQTAKFDALAASIGTVGDALLTDLQAATGGMVTDAKLVAGAVDLMNLGLVQSHEEVIRWSAAISALNLDMQVLGLTLANDSTARLDSLGLSMTVVNEKTQKFVNMGYETSKAFDLAVLEALEEKMSLFGDAAETTTGKLQRFETSWTNLTDRLKSGLAEGFAPAVDRLTEFMDEVANANDDLQRAYGQGLVTQEEYNELALKAALGFDGAVERLQQVRDAMRTLNFGDELARIAAGAHALDAAVTTTGADFGFSLLPMLSAAGIGATEMALAFERGAIMAERGLTSVSGPLVGMIGQLREARAEVGGFFNQISAGAAIDPAGLLMDTAAAAGASARNLYEMAGATDEALQALVDATIAAKAEELGNAVAAGAMTGVQALAELEQFAQNLNLNPTELLEPTVLSTETAASVIKANTLALVEGVSQGATTASRTATTAVDELRTRTEDLVTMPKPLEFETNDAAVRSVLDEMEVWAAAMRGPWPIEFNVTTTGTPPAGAGGSSGAPPPPTGSGGTGGGGGGGGAPGGSGPAGRGPAGNNTTNYTTNNYWTNGVSPGTLDNALANYGRRYSGATR
ncbi:MAG: hypothetical protein IPM49_00085 [Flavobacteriales bacterium]|nr:hypothetical protein [Flavobacteriales bacterium]